MKFSDLKINDNFMLDGEYCKKVGIFTYVNSSQPAFGEIYMIPADEWRVEKVIVNNLTKERWADTANIKSLVEVPGSGITKSPVYTDDLNSANQAIKVLDTKVAYYEKKMFEIEALCGPLAEIVTVPSVKKSGLLYNEAMRFLRHMELIFGKEFIKPVSSKNAKTLVKKVAGNKSSDKKQAGSFKAPK